MPRTDVLIIGAGQAGLAMSRCLSDLDIEHVVLERGQVAQRWRQDGWDSLRLLTPNWMTRLPGHQYRGGDPDGFMTVPALVRLLEDYAASSRAPVVTGTTVRRVEAWDDRFRVATNRGVWCATSVVVATGYCDRAAIPATSRALAPWIEQLVPAQYRHPEQLPRDGVLIVGASATGVQLADEIQRSGRQVTLAVGRHTRLPRRYRGQDILWWLDQLGVLTQDTAAVHNLEASRDQPSLQLVGRADHATLDLDALVRLGVRLTGRMQRIDGCKVHLADDLIATLAAADVKLAAIRTRIDEFIARADPPAKEPEPFVPTWPLAAHAPEQLDLRTERIGTVIWATGYRRSYPWLRVPVVDGGGEIHHQGGVTPHRGLYVLGLNFQRRRNSSFIDGVGDDARFLAEHIGRFRLHRRIA
ncbi:MAG TPA: NAD(P)/FAD-dependent oxidoreductase [Vicinamibacterales bacterium]|nr:NAD(P)/FAD-dependent oxidoreductase [Vicinamibacterales bacterium]